MLLAEIFNQIDQEGYPNEIFLKPSKVDKYKCPIHFGLLNNPVQDQEGHAFCKKCIEPWILQQMAVNSECFCPISRNPISIEQLTSVTTIVKNAINEQPVKCIMHSMGCSFQDKLEKLKSHLFNDCKYVTINCKYTSLNEIDGCSFQGLRHEVEIHEKHCRFMTILCENCQDIIYFHQYQNHMESCPCLIMNCQLGCGKQMQKSSMLLHVQLQCPNYKIECQIFITKILLGKKKIIQRALIVMLNKQCFLIKAK